MHDYSVMKYLILLLLWSPIAFASSYPDPNELFFVNLGLSVLIYIVFGIILVMFKKLKSLHMLPFFIVMMITVAATFLEVLFKEMLGENLIGRAFIGASISTAIYLYVVKRSLKNESLSEQSESID